MTTPQPTVASQPAPAPIQASSAAPSSLAGVPVADIPPEWQPLVTNLMNAYNRMESVGVSFLSFS